ncbi:hypothetical protein ACFLS9_05720 [Bacteroidota bacterium]
MGFSVLLDILGSIVIGGFLFLTLIRLNDTAVKNNHLYGSELIVQQNLIEVVDLLEHDLKKIGYCADWKKIPDPSKSILSAGHHRISFLTDIEGDGQLDTLMYFWWGLDILEKWGINIDLIPETQNPNDRILYRTVNGERPEGSNLGVTQFDFTFFDAFGNTLDFPITSPAQINSMQINLTVENIYAYDNEYASAFWRQIRLAARNLNNR